ncbi:MAG TPA: hypothetical protein VGU63_15340 [Candidatus Acidoferrales bacterium]|nr:hypothetical protein [Candidatus Acidoferrales bacterium]
MSELAQKYPSIELAYPIAVASFDVAARRLDIVDGRLQTILAFIVTVSAAVPSVAARSGVCFASGWFYLGLALFVICVTLGTYARLSGKLKVLSPANLFAEWLADQPEVFQKDMVYYAGQAFAANLHLVKRKWQFSVWVTTLFAIEIAVLVVWVLSAQT